MTYQKCPVLLMCHDSISEGFFHTPLRAGAAPESWQPKIAASIEKYRLTCADSGARGKQFLRREYPTLAYSTRGCWLAPAPASRPLPPPPLWSSHLALGEVDAHFLEFGEVSIVSPRLGPAWELESRHPDRRNIPWLRAATFPIVVWWKADISNRTFLVLDPTRHMRRRSLLRCTPPRQ